MSIQKKSLISNRVAVKKALIASQPAESQQDNSLKAKSLTAHSMRSKRNAAALNFKRLRGASLKSLREAL